MVSILLPAYKDAPGIAEAIQSVLNQTYTDWELIVIDDGLSATARAVVEHYIIDHPKIVLLPFQGNKGIQSSLNRGLRIARGEYIARIDDDDQWIDKEKLSKQVAYLDEHTDCVLVGTNAVTRDEHGALLSTYAMPLTNQAIRSRMLFKNCFLHPTIMMRKSTIDQVGGYDESSKTLHIEDYALWLRLGQYGTIVNLPDSAAELTVHTDSLTFKNRITQAKKIRALIGQYKDIYPYFYFATFILCVRIAGFMVIRFIPLSQKMLHAIQRTYKSI